MDFGGDLEWSTFEFEPLFSIFHIPLHSCFGLQAVTKVGELVVLDKSPFSHSPSSHLRTIQFSNAYLAKGFFKQSPQGEAYHQCKVCPENAKHLKNEKGTGYTDLGMIDSSFVYT